MGLDYSASGLYRAGRRRITITRASGSSFTAQLYYPATATGDGTPYDGSGAPYPAITFGHGFLQPVERYRSTLEHLASWGYLVITTESEGGLFPSHARLAEDMRACLTYLEQQNEDSGSWLYQQVHTERFGASGHSMGGGASLLATATDSRIKAVANLAAAETNPSAIQACANITVPMSLIAGSADSITPVANHGQRMYNNGFAPKLLPIIQGGWHCGFEDVSTFGCDSGPMSRTEQLALTRWLLTAFFELYLRNDLQAWDYVWGDAVRSNPRIVLTADSGIMLKPDFLRRSVTVPRVMEYRLALTNRSRYEQRYALTAEGNRWHTVVIPEQTGVLTPESSTLVRVLVYVPRTRRLASDTVRVRALLLRDGGTCAVSMLTTLLR